VLAADRAKAIKTKAVVNESPTDKLIRELREENARLQELLKKGGVPAAVPGDGAAKQTPEGESFVIARREARHGAMPRARL